jgi:hypothetical protein
MLPACPLTLPSLGLAQLIVVVEILIAKCDGEHPLADQRRDLVLDQFPSPLVVKARRKPIHQSDCPIRRAQKQSPRIRRHQPASNPASTARPSTVPTSNCSAIHSVGIGAPFESAQSRCGTTTFADSGARCA